MAPRSDIPLMVFKKDRKKIAREALIFLCVYLALILFLFFLPVLPVLIIGIPVISAYFWCDTNGNLCIITVFTDRIEIHPWGSLRNREKTILISDITDIKASWSEGKTRHFILRFNQQPPAKRINCRHAFYSKELMPLFTFLHEKNIPVMLHEQGNYPALFSGE